MSLHYQPRLMQHSQQRPPLIPSQGVSYNQGVHQAFYAQYSQSLSSPSPRRQQVTSSPSAPIGTSALSAYSSGASPATRSTPISSNIASTFTDRPGSPAVRPSGTENMTPRLSADTLQIDQDKFGVGIQFDSVTLKVKALLTGYSADRSNSIQVNDEIVAVDSQGVNDARQARLMLLGSQGSTVNVSLKRNSQRIDVQLMRGTPEFLQLVEKARDSETEVRELKEQNTELRNQNSRNQDTLSILSSVTKASGSQDVRRRPIRSDDLLDRLTELERQNAGMRQEKEVLEAKCQELSACKEQLTSMTSEYEMLKHQVTSLQKLIGEKDGLISQAKAKGREQQANLLARVRELEDALKERISTKNNTISELQKQVVEYKEEILLLKAEIKRLKVEGLEIPSTSSPGLWANNGNGTEGRLTILSKSPDHPRSPISAVSVSPVISSLDKCRISPPDRKQGIEPKSSRYGVQPHNRSSDAEPLAISTSGNGFYERRSSQGVDHVSGQSFEKLGEQGSDKLSNQKNEMDIHGDAQLSSRPGSAFSQKSLPSSTFSKVLPTSRATGSGTTNGTFNPGVQSYQQYRQIYPVQPWQPTRWA